MDNHISRDCSFQMPGLFSGVGRMNATCARCGFTADTSFRVGTVTAAIDRLRTIEAPDVVICTTCMEMIK